MFQRNTFFPLKEERKMIDPKKKSGNEKAIDLLYNEVSQYVSFDFTVVVLTPCVAVCQC